MDENHYGWDRVGTFVSSSQSFTVRRQDSYVTYLITFKKEQIGVIKLSTAYLSDTSKQETQEGCGPFLLGYFHVSSKGYLLSQMTCKNGRKDLN